MIQGRSWMDFSYGEPSLSDINSNLLPIQKAKLP